MGDRGQVAVKQESGTIWLYTHWSGSELEDTVAAAIKRGQGRWGDEEYLTRIIFSQMIKDNVMADTCFGIGLKKHGDLNNPVVYVDIAEKRMRIGKRAYSFSQIAATIEAE